MLEGGGLLSGWSSVVVVYGRYICWCGVDYDCLCVVVLGENFIY